MIFIKIFFISLLIIISSIFLFIFFNPAFGGSPDLKSQEKIKASPNFNGKIFKNQKPLTLMTQSGTLGTLSAWLTEIMNPPAGKTPDRPIPTEKLDIKALQQNNHFTWLGHSSLLLKMQNKMMAIDPVFYRASPIMFGGKPFEMTNTPKISDLPYLDIVLISHDHYDHLDYKAIKELNDKIGHYYVPLGVKGHLQRWGVADNKITELDWFENANAGGLSITLTPTRHFSGRNLHNRFTTLWGAWVLKSDDLNIYFNSDSGYGEHFKETGEKYGVFDIAFMENGAYNEKWTMVHMKPEETASAGIDINAKIIMPIHWGKFDLSNHSWKDPIIRFLAATKNANIKIATPKIGQTFTLENIPKTSWWEF